MRPLGGAPHDEEPARVPVRERLLGNQFRRKVIVEI